jgi:hypothetical protein
VAALSGWMSQQSKPARKRSEKAVLPARSKRRYQRDSCYPPGYKAIIWPIAPNNEQYFDRFLEQPIYYGLGEVVSRRFFEISLGKAVLHNKA